METIILQQQDPAVLEVATLALEENYRILAFTEIPSNILQLIEKRSPKLIILDFIIDGKKAIKTLMKIRKLTKKIPIVAMSCNSDIEQAAAIKGFDGCLKKPFNIDELLTLGEIFIKRIKTDPTGSVTSFCVNS